MVRGGGVVEGGHGEVVDADEAYALVYESLGGAGL